MHLMQMSCTRLLHLAFIFCLNLLTINQIDAKLHDWLWNEVECYTEDSRWITSGPPLPNGVPWRAQRTLPPGLILAKSSIPGAGLGVFSTTFIPRYTWLAEYEGEIVLSAKDISDYAWRIYRGDDIYYFLDGRDEATSNWPRYINCSRMKKEENVCMLQCFDKPFYITWRDVYPGEELLIYYGDDYAEYLEIDVSAYHDAV